jgi:uncharacterized membrane protein YjjB (DUF3815 family)
MEMNWTLVKVLIAAVLFACLAIARTKKIKTALLWGLTGYLIYLGATFK